MAVSNAGSLGEVMHRIWILHGKPNGSGKGGSSGPRELREALRDPGPTPVLSSVIRMTCKGNESLK